MRFLISILLIIVLLVSVGYWSKLIYQRYEPKEKYIYQPQTQNVTQDVVESSEEINSDVLVIYIPKIGRRLRIDPLYVDVTSDAGSWPISNRGVNLVTSTGEPGSGGNSVIYGHNWKSIFGDLRRLQAGDEVIVYRTSDDQKLFTVSNVSVVDPADGDLLLDHGQNELTLYTCTGLLDSKRLVVTTSFVEGLDGSL